MDPIILEFDEAFEPFQQRTMAVFDGSRLNIYHQYRDQGEEWQTWHDEGSSLSAEGAHALKAMLACWDFDQ